ncbi:trypsin II-P29-like [Xiphophorus hellerii]|uniref:trypsin II-P29-like n=1 Tax=Xiphophorus hellerii TaxID=8084 RepID=UPI0013B44947|nr:trypsin II-P29-like [Xiphophorus hellerii]
MALLKVLLLLGLGVSVNSNVSLQKRIIGGHDCDDRERLYHVRIESSNYTTIRLCGGSLIDAKWILTAAHCWESEAGWINVAMLKVHPRRAKQQNHVIRYDPVIYTDQGQKHDIMLLKLQRPVTDIPPARLPRCQNRPKIGDTVQLAGEGGTTTGPNYERNPNNRIPKHLQCVNMSVVLDTHFRPTCGKTFLTDAQNKDICLGDSGSAVVFNGMIYGVIVECGTSFACLIPSTIIDVCEYMDWIKQTTGLK